MLVNQREFIAERIVKMMQKLPYYMVYPMPFVYDDERIEERDMEYMKSLYPDAAKRILPYIEEECDRLEYQCSMIYDEYPDRLQLQMMCKRICENVKKHGKILDGMMNIPKYPHIQSESLRRTAL